jgi:negative regulator of flagellin synthesis FlgM
MPFFGGNMKVDNKIGSSLTNVDATKSGKISSKLGLDKPENIKNSTKAEGSSKVDVSERAQMMQKAKEIASRDMVDDAKVSRIQKLIDEGKYKTDAAAIADKLVDTHMDFPE